MSKFSDAVKSLRDEFSLFRSQLTALNAEIAHKEARSEHFFELLTLDDVADFAQRNFYQNISEILNYINSAILPNLFKTELYSSIAKSEEFNVKDYYQFISSVNVNSDLIRARYDEKLSKIYLVLNEDRVSLNDYANAVISAREVVGVSSKTSPATASKYWALYYQAARTPSAIRVKPRGKKDESTLIKDYARNYWRMIKTRISFFPPDTIPFFYILELGTEAINLQSDRGGTPYPIIPKFGILANVNKLLVNELENLKKNYTDYLKKEFLAIDVEIPDITDKIEDIEKLIIDLYEKNVQIRLPEIISGDFSELQEYIKRDIRKYFSSLGYQKVSVRVIKTKKDSYSITARTSDGRFARWRSR
ncbi:MAG: hypothetical protein ACUVT3_00700 [Ignavibacterium sp.]